ncbi:hypothetical protein C5S31_07245 [ANME-1 cluster archaeon GoMg2]|nr:hypothetical protein [ANME-1 cluster archaeon GoMg2]
MMDSYQVDGGIKSKKASGKAAKEKIARRIKERTDIHGIGEASSTRISRSGGGVNLLNANYEITSEKFVRSLHKCIANILCDLYGSIYVRKNYRELLYFVQNGGDVRPWSYAVSYPAPFIRPLISEPRVVNRCLIKINNKSHEIISFIHTSGIWIVGSSPHLLNPNLIGKISDSIITELASQKEHISKKPMTGFFGFEWNKEKRSTIGKLKFLWVVKEIEGKPNDDFLYLLTRCKVCGQINPTGIVLPREIIYHGNVNNAISYSKNTWNHYIMDDLVKLGFRIERWGDKNLKKYIDQGISIPIENEVKKMRISNCKINCIGCNNLIKFSSDDCFI